MSGFSSSTIFTPKDWQLFERNTRLLFEYSLKDPHTQNNGRQGQPQHGVDVFGRRGGKDGPFVGVQCKGKDANFGEPVTEKELREEVRKSEGFKPALREFILVTTAPDDANIQEKSRLLEQEIRAQGRNLSISVWGWGRLEQEIIRFPEVLRAFQPDAMPYGDRIFDELAEIRAAVSRQVEPLFLSGSDKSALTPIASPTPPTQIAADRKSQSDSLACTRFRRHRVRCFYGTGGGSWRDEGLRGSSSLKLCG